MQFNVISQDIRATSWPLPAEVNSSPLRLVSFNNIEANGWTILPQPSYSPDLAPSDFYLFGPSKDYLGGQKFEDDEVIRAHLLSQKTSWNKCVKCNGDYTKYTTKLCSLVRWYRFLLQPGIYGATLWRWLTSYNSGRKRRVLLEVRPELRQDGHQSKRVEK